MRVTLRIYVAFVFCWSINGTHTSYMRLPCHRAPSSSWSSLAILLFRFSECFCHWLVGHCAWNEVTQWNGENVRNQNSFDILRPTYMCCSHFADISHFVLKIRHTTMAQYIVLDIMYANLLLLLSVMALATIPSHRHHPHPDCRCSHSLKIFSKCRK